MVIAYTCTSSKLGPKWSKSRMTRYAQTLSRHQRGSISLVDTLPLRLGRVVSVSKRQVCHAQRLYGLYNLWPRPLSTPGHPFEYTIVAFVFALKQQSVIDLLAMTSASRKICCMWRKIIPLEILRSTPRLPRRENLKTAWH